MADRYWVGGSGAWSSVSTTNWSATSGGSGGASVPTSNDNVFFDQAGTYTVTSTSGNVFCLDITVSAGSVTLSGNVGIYVSGSLSFISGTVSSGSGFFAFGGYGLGKTITTNGTVLNGIDIIGAGGEWTLGSALAIPATKTFGLTAGSLILNGFDITCGTFTSNNTNVRSVTFGSNYIYLTTTSVASTNLVMPTATNFSSTDNAPTAGGFAAAGTITRTFTVGTTGAPTLPPSVYIYSGSAVQTFTTGSYFNVLNVSGSAGTIPSTSVNIKSLVLGVTQNGLTANILYPGGVVICNGTSLGNLTINHAGTTTLAGSLSQNVTTLTTLTQGTLDLNGFNLNTGRFSSDNSNVRAVNFGSNYIVLNTGTAAQSNLSMTTSTNFSCSGTGGFYATMNTTRSFSCGNSATTLTPPNLFLSSGASVASFGLYSVFNILDTGSCTYAWGASSGVMCQTFNSPSTSSTTSGLRLFMWGTGTLTYGGAALRLLLINETTTTSLGLPVGTTTLGSNVTSGATSATLGAGTLTLNGFSLTCSQFLSSYATTRQVNFGSTYIITTLTTGTRVDLTNATNFTATGTGGFYASATAVTASLIIGNSNVSPYNPPTVAPNVFLAGSATSSVNYSYINTLDYTYQTSTATPSGVPNCKNLVLGGAAGVTYAGLQPTMYDTGTITTNGKQLQYLTINHSGTTTLNDTFSTIATGGIYLTSGTLNLNGFNATTGFFVSNNSNTRAVTFGANYIYLTHTSAGILVVEMPNATSFSASGTGGFSAAMDRTRTFTLGTTGAPTAAPNLFLTSGASIPTLTLGSYFGSLNFTGSTCTPATTSLNLTGLVLATGGTYTGLTPNMVGSGTIDSAGKTIPSLTINHSGTTTLANSVTATSLTLTQGTLNLSSSNITVSTFSSSGTAVRSITGDGGGGTAILVTGAGAAWTVTDGTNFTGSGYYIRMASDSPKTFAGGGGSYGQLRQYGVSTGVLTVTGSNSFTDIQATQVPATIRFTAGTTTTLANFTLSGVSGNNVTINSTTAGSQFTLYKASDTVSVNYLTIQDSNVTGGAYWGTTTSTFVSNNTGWNPVKSTGNFMAFF